MMFSDEAAACVEIQSSWRRSQQSFQNHNQGCQTKALQAAEAAVQSVCSTDSGTQTEPQHGAAAAAAAGAEQLQHSGLLEFLQRVEDDVVQQLASRDRSHAFDGFNVNWEERVDGVSCLHCLHWPGAAERGLHVTAVSWGCTGRLVACAYGRIDGGDWSTQSSVVCTWNLQRGGLKAQQAAQTLDVPTAVTALCCHPSQPALIAGGLYTGEVVVWDTSGTRDPVLVQTGMSVDGHREPVYHVEWLQQQQKKGDYGLLSCCSGGKVLLWRLDSLDQQNLSLTAAYALVQQQLPHSSSSSSSSSRFKRQAAGHSSSSSASVVGLTSLDLSPWDSNTFLLGSEGGLLLRCSFSRHTLAAVSSPGHTVAPRAPAVFSFRPASGPVHSIHCSPFHRNLFVQAGADGEVHLHSLLRSEPLLSVRVSHSSVFQVRWSPARPLVFAAATGTGEVQVFDLGVRTLKPAATLSQGEAAHAATCLAFNPASPELLAVGGTDATVCIWRLSAELTQQKPRESRQLEQLANQLAD
ncbi:cytoplasmic dynein 2 intermediate chain 2 isoform X2 [Nelusetta ayraudi]|uniref:cytoplasmic dynein 2 intermediate chain 2 isoform X2 n=1 Tax=Nelusetta ayraudi TaxID=303726 RepID=UPI003F728EBD